MSQSRRVALTIALLLLFMALLVGGFVYRMGVPRTMSPLEMQVNGLYLHETPRNFGEIRLLDHHGAAFTRERFEGRWSLVFFGFTHCPDICPTTMSFLDGFGPFRSCIDNVEAVVNAGWFHWYVCARRMS